jgi:hypothetical protein
MLELAAGMCSGARCMRHQDRNEHAKRKPELADLRAANRSPGAIDRLFGDPAQTSLAEGAWL